MTKHKILYIGILATLFFGVLIFYSGSTSLFQGRLTKSVKPLPAYDENRCNDSDGGKNYDEDGTVFGKISRSQSGSKSDFCSSNTQLTEYYCDGKFVKNEKYICENGCADGACKKINANLSNKLDTLVIVDTDSYDITEKDVKEFFELAGNLWLKPKTGVDFNLTKIVFASLSEECPQHLGSCDSGGWMEEDFPYFDEKLPEYIVFLTKGMDTTTAGAHAGATTYYWLDPSMEGFYNPESNNEFCTEFPPPYDNYYTVPSGFIDYGHKIMRCGYDEIGKNIISNVSINGECKNQAGLNCIVKNGYQQCPNLSEDDNFYLKNPLHFSASSMVHEMLHSYGENGNLDHFETAVCKDAMGEKMKELEDKGVSAPFDTLKQEYTVMCPNVWENFKNSQQSCD